MRFPQVVRAGLAAALVPLALGACGAPKVSMPPVTPSATNQQHPGMFVWHDLFTADVEAAEAFYGGLFGWRFQAVPELENYRLALLDGRPVAGIVHAPKATQAIWINHLSVPDVDAAVTALTAGGGEVLAPAREVAGRGRLAVVTDPKGAVLALTRAASGDPADVLAPTNAIFWTELWAHDPPEHIALYRSLLGYEIDSRALGGTTYTVLTRDGRPRAGVIKSPYDQVPARWLPYVRVNDPIGYTKRAQELGGKVLVQPSNAVRGGTAALIVDPTGAPFAMQQWPLPDSEGGN